MAHNLNSGSKAKRPANDDEVGEKRQKISFGVSSSGIKVKPGLGKSTGGLQIKLNTQKASNLKPMENKNRDVFNDEEEEPEEMPPEAKMKMRNIGRDTPTSAGPNSFGKTKQGFCNVKKVFEKSLKASLENDD